MYKEKESRRKRISSREALTEKMARKYPDRTFETDDDFFDALQEYDSHLCERYQKLSDDQQKLCSLFMSNPKMGAFIADVVSGEDALVSCVRYFGKDLLESAGDESRLDKLREANEEYLSRINRFSHIEKQMRDNLNNSQGAISRFKESEGMSDNEFTDFIERVYHLCDHVFMGDLNVDVLDLLYKGVNYDSDLSCAEKAAVIRGRNERIQLEKKHSLGDTLPNLHSAPAVSDSEDDNLTPAFGRRRRRSIWDM